ncbi:hypothetical protein K469DRAFT_691181 [Zopfia rhizophila CBS 207.26]|uniref:Uncharacterized protein n=1 Tax=Zopfia rhizophila CBS 207.26 TaxID=1314779 RepID=A0A6A6ERJ7_9PEZI|nr:hypothetical protein K469DRAFT_691181 [Zopfia rhizophila CBS 207.26]
MAQLKRKQSAMQDLATSSAPPQKVQKVSHPDESEGYKSASGWASINNPDAKLIAPKDDHESKSSDLSELSGADQEGQGKLSEVELSDIGRKQPKMKVKQPKLSSDSESGDYPPGAGLIRPYDPTKDPKVIAQVTVNTDDALEKENAKIEPKELLKAAEAKEMLKNSKAVRDDTSEDSSSDNGKQEASKSTDHKDDAKTSEDDASATLKTKKKQRYESKLVPQESRRMAKKGTKDASLLAIRVKNKKTDEVKFLTFKKSPEDFNWDSDTDIDWLNRWRTQIFGRGGNKTKTVSMWHRDEEYWVELEYRLLIKYSEINSKVRIPTLLQILSDFNKFFIGRKLIDPEGDELPPRTERNYSSYTSKTGRGSIEDLKKKLFSLQGKRKGGPIYRPRISEQMFQKFKRMKGLVVEGKLEPEDIVTPDDPSFIFPEHKGASSSKADSKKSSKFKEGVDNNDKGKAKQNAKGMDKDDEPDSDRADNSSTDENEAGKDGVKGGVTEEAAKAEIVRLVEGILLRKEELSKVELEKQTNPTTDAPPAAAEDGLSESPSTEPEEVAAVEALVAITSDAHASARTGDAKLSRKRFRDDGAVDKTKDDDAEEAVNAPADKKHKVSTRAHATEPAEKTPSVTTTTKRRAIASRVSGLILMSRIRASYRRRSEWDTRNLFRRKGCSLGVNRLQMCVRRNIHLDQYVKAFELPKILVPI